MAYFKFTQAILAGKSIDGMRRKVFLISPIDDIVDGILAVIDDKEELTSANIGCSSPDTVPCGRGSRRCFCLKAKINWKPLLRMTCLTLTVVSKI